MGVTNKEYEHIVGYIVQYLEKTWERVGGINAVDVISLPGQCSYEDWKESYKPAKKKAEGISKEVEEAFEIFWKEYPGISRFEYMGKKFEGERVLKANKQVCLKLYNDAIISIVAAWVHIKLSVLGASQTLSNALNVQLETIKQESYKTGQNRLQYMKSCEVYLRQKAYEPWIGQEMPQSLIQKKVVDTTYNG